MTGVRLVARLLGTFEVEIDGRRLDRTGFERPSGLRLLKLLLATPEHRVRREVAAELLWPEADPDRSDGNLRKAIHFARRGLAGLAGDQEVIAGEGDWLQFAPPVRLDVDADHLTDALRRLETGHVETGVAHIGATDDPLETVAELGGADLLPEDPYEEWLLPLRERLRERVLAATMAGVARARERARPELAERLATRALAIDPADESAHRALIELHLEAGRLHAARRQLLACRRALADAYAVEPSPELVALVDAAAASRSHARSGSAREAEIIGRHLELDRAEPVLDAVAAGALGALVIRGPAGIGKSRLLREVAQLGAAGGWRMLELRGLERSGEAPYAALGRAVEGAIDTPDLDDWPEPARSAMLSITPGRDASSADRPSGGERGTKPVIEFATEAGLREGLVDALRRLGGERPIVIAIDDIQWLDSATLALLRAALEGDALPMLVIATLRDEPADPDPFVQELIRTVEARGGTQIRLGPLGQREIEQLLEREVSGGSLDGEVARAIAELAGGTPLFALQLLHDAQERGFVSLREGRWQMATTGERLPVPEGVRRAVEDRAARLPPGVRAVLGVAAELGDEVTYELLVAAAEAGPETVLDALDRGLELDLLIERAGRYRFGHPLYRAALRGDVPRRARADLHARIATALAGDVDPEDALAVATAIASGVDALGIASHAAEAVELGQARALPLAVAFGIAAGARQNALFDHAGAVATLRRAVGLWLRLPAAARQAYPVSAAHHQLGVALKASGDPAAAAEAYRAEIATATNDRDRARGYAALSWLPYEHGRFERSAEVLREGIGAVRDPTARAFLESGLGWIRGRQGDWHAAHELLEPAVEVLERGAPADLLARALDRFAVAIRDLGQPARSIPVFRRALALCDESGNRHDEAIVRMHLATALRDAGEVDAARPHVDRAIELTRMTGDRYIEAVSHWILAEVEDTAGDLDAAAAARRSELAILGALGGNPQNQAMAHAHLAHLATRAGNTAAAAVEAEAARAHAAHAGLDYLPGLVERAIAAVDWFRVSHRHADGSDADGIAAAPTG